MAELRVEKCSTSSDHAAPAHVRVGVILPQDGTTQLQFLPPPYPFTIIRAPSASAGFSLNQAVLHISVETNELYTARLEGDSIRLERGGETLAHSPTWSIEPVTECEHDGVTLRDCIAGRGFHWRSRIDEVLPGRIDISIARLAGGQPALLVVNELPVETYLKGVITSEMSGAAPIEFLKAQCLVARSWMTAAADRKHVDLGIDFCNDDCCQRYQGVAAVTRSARAAVEETAGRVLVHRSGEIVDANYCKSCGGIVEDPQHVWGVAKAGQHTTVDAPPDSPLNRLHPVDRHNIAEYVRGEWLEHCDAYCSPNVVPESEISRYLGGVDAGGGLFRWSVDYSVDRLEDLLRGSPGGSPSHDGRRAEPGDDGFGRLYDLVVTRRGSSGRATRLEIVYDDTHGKRRTSTIDDQYRIRRALHDSCLYSSAFDIRIQRDAHRRPQRIELHGAGWGHGAGMCQIGALGMALNGMDHTRILNHYFKDVTITALPKPTGCNPWALGKNPRSN